MKQENSSVIRVTNPVIVFVAWTGNLELFFLDGTCRDGDVNHRLSSILGSETWLWRRHHHHVL